MAPTGKSRGTQRPRTALNCIHKLYYIVIVEMDI